MYVTAEGGIGAIVGVTRERLWIRSKGIQPTKEWKRRLKGATARDENLSERRLIVSHRQTTTVWPEQRGIFSTNEWVVDEMSMPLHWAKASAIDESSSTIQKVSDRTTSSAQTTLRYHLRGEFSVLLHDIGIGGLTHGDLEEEWKFFF